MINLKNILLNILIGSVLFAIGYFGIRYLLSKNKIPECAVYATQDYKKYSTVDSLLIVVDSLTVQVDSLHRQGNKFVPQKVDTALIIARYYKTFHYTIEHKDKNLDLRLNFDHSRLNIRNPVLEYRITKPVSIYRRQDNKHLFAGVTLGISPFEMNQFTPEIIFFTGKHGFKMGYDLLNRNRNFQIGYYFKIK